MLISILKSCVSRKSENQKSGNQTHPKTGGRKRWGWEDGGMNKMTCWFVSSLPRLYVMDSLHASAHSRLHLPAQINDPFLPLWWPLKSAYLARPVRTSKVAKPPPRCSKAQRTWAQATFLRHKLPSCGRPLTYAKYHPLLQLTLTRLILCAVAVILPVTSDRRARLRLFPRRHSVKCKRLKYMKHISLASTKLTLIHHKTCIPWLLYRFLWKCICGYWMTKSIGLCPDTMVDPLINQPNLGGEVG